MVLADLGRRINSAFTELSRVPLVDDKAVDALLRTVTAALLESDVNVKLVGQLRDNVRTDVRQQLNDPEKGQKLNEVQRKNLVQKAVYDHLVKLVDPGQEPFKPKKGKPNVIMFVGLQGSGKTTSCTKLALYYSKRGFKTGLVCADTFRAGAFDQLKQNATKANIPFYGSYTEADPVVIASEGVANFKANRFEVIIVDTSGRHKQESELFNEMVEIQDAVTPDQTIMVLDASIGQAAENQSRAFKEAAGFGAIFLTKIDGHAKGGGAISAVAATQTPIIFIGVGEHVTDLETFRPGPFISKMLGMGDLSGLMETAQEMAAINPQGQEEMIKKITEGGTFTIRDWRNQIGNIMGMGPISKLAGMIPGMGQMLGGGQGEEASAKMKRMLFITDSMTPEELDSDGHMFTAPIKDPAADAAAAEEEKALELDKPAADGEPPRKKKKKQTRVRLTARARRVARGSGTSVGEVEEFLVQYRMISKMVKKMGGIGGFMNQMKGGQSGRGPAGGMPNMTPEMRQQAMAMQNALPPEIKAQLRQPGGREKLMQQMQSGQMPPGMEGLMGGMGGMGGGGFPGMGGMGGGGGMPDMAQLQSMMSSMGGMGGMANMMKSMMGGGAPGAGPR